MRQCHDCKVKRKDVDIRQCDYFLCDNCEAIRQQGAKPKTTSKPTSKATTS